METTEIKAEQESDIRNKGRILGIKAGGKEAL